MTVKIVHEAYGHQVRFGDRATAEHYATQHGGLADWRVVMTPAAAQFGNPNGSQGRAESRTGE